jgi:DNA-binding MarR family transcriptional regulator
MAYYLRQFKLGVPQVQILHAVGGRGPLASKQIADVLAMNKALVSRSLRELTDLGYVTSTGDSQDARLRVWSLTAEGQNFVARARSVRIERQNRFLSVLTKEEQLLLVDVLDRLFASSELLRVVEDTSPTKSSRAKRQPPSRGPNGQAPEGVPAPATSLSRST